MDILNYWYQPEKSFLLRLVICNDPFQYKKD